MTVWNTCSTATKGPDGEGAPAAGSLGRPLSWVGLALTLICAGCSSETGAPAWEGENPDEPAVNPGQDPAQSGGSMPGSTASAPGADIAPGQSGTDGSAVAPGSTATGSAPTPGVDSPTADSGDTGPIELPESACSAQAGQLDVGLTKLRRLTHTQLNNTIRDLVGIADDPAAGLVPDAAVGPFENNAFSPATALIVEQYDEMAFRVAELAVPKMAQLSPCDLTADSTSACATTFVTQFGQKAYRRPLTAEEVTAHVSLFELGRAEADATNGFRLVVAAMLQSPFFLYHWDVGATGTPQNGVVPVSSWELASRLSYFLWNTLPDDELFAAAADDSLTQDAVLDQQVSRLLADSKAGDAIRLFHLQWLKVYDLSRVEEKDTTVFPAYGPSFLASMQAETGDFADYVVRRGDGLMSTLMTANWSIIDSTMAGVYGVPFSSSTEPTVLPEGQRAGLLTQAAFLTRHAHRVDSSPVHRGLTVRTNILCDTVQAPPAGVSTTLPDPALATSTRERFALHLADPSCAGCHLLMDPIGLSFEHYDAIGAWRETDQYGPVDAAGEVIGGQGRLSGTYYGAVELAQRLADSDDVASCMADQWFRFALGRMESASDACSIQALQSEFAASGYHIPTLLRSIIKSDAFRNVRATEL